MVATVIVRRVILHATVMLTRFLWTGKDFLHTLMMLQNSQRKLLDTTIVKLLYIHWEATEITKYTTDFLANIFESQLSF